MFIEPDLPGDPFKVSDADTMLKYLNPKAKPKVAVTIFTKRVVLIALGQRVVER